MIELIAHRFLVADEEATEETPGRAGSSTHGYDCAFSFA